MLRRLRQRQERGNSAATRLALAAWADTQSVRQADLTYLPLPPSTKSTIAVAFAPNGLTFASTHGDHTVKLTCFHTQRVLRTLVGHPRTPWTVSYHPTNTRLLASGCIGSEVRIWDTRSGHCLHRATLDLPIISLSFHPGTRGAHVLAIATFHSLWLWPYEVCPQPYHEWRSNRLLRCVCFPPPDGRHILIGLGNDSRPPEAGMLQQPPLPPPQAAPGPKTFHLFAWDFDVHKALVARQERPPSAPPRDRRAQGNNGGGSKVQYYASPMSRPRPLLERALLYNDGGLDISACGRFLVTCAEFHEHDFVASSGGRSAAAAVLRAPYVVKLSLTSLLEETDEEERGGRRDAIADTEAAAGGGGGGGGATRPAPPSWSKDKALADMEQDGPAAAAAAEEEEEEEAAAAANVVVPLTPYRYHAPRDKYLAPILSARPLQGMALGAVTSVKLSATGSLVVLGYGGIRRDDLGMQQQGSGSHAPVVAEVYATEGMEPVRAIRSAEDDVNIARFHPFPGHGFLYGTKQGRVCMLVRGHGGLEEEEAWW